MQFGHVHWRISVESAQYRKDALIFLVMSEVQNSIRFFSSNNAHGDKAIELSFSTVW